MEPIIIETSLGHKVFIKPLISFGDQRAIQKAINERLAMDMETEKPQPITVADMKAGNDKAFELLVQKVVMPDGSVAQKPLAVIYDLDPSDGKKIVAKIDEIYEASKSTEETKKNVTISAPEPS